MNLTPEETLELPEDLRNCVSFHGHFCPGLTYGYLVAREALKVLGLSRSHDEEVVAVCENDSCAVDAVQVMLGTTMGKGNLFIHNYGKSVFTVLSREKNRALRFSRKTSHRYKGEDPETFLALEERIKNNTAGPEEKRRHKILKARALLAQPFDEIFHTEEVDCVLPAYAPLAPSKACAKCGEMTMATRMREMEGGGVLCIPCSETSPD